MPRKHVKRTASGKSQRRAGKLRLSMMVGDYEIVRALKEGEVKPKGIDLIVAKYPGTRVIHGSR